MITSMIELMVINNKMSRKLILLLRAILKRPLYLVGYLLFIPLSYLMPKNKKYVVFASRFGDFEGNLKHFFLYLNSLGEDLEFIYLTEKKEVYRKLKKRGFKAWYYPRISTFFRMLRTPYLIVDGNEWAGNLKFFILYNTKKVQLWHGTGFKTIGLLKPSIKKLSRFRRRFRKDYIYYHLLTLSSEYQVRVRSKAFRYSKLLINGLPRNDIFFQQAVPADDLGSDSKTIRKCIRLQEQGLKIVTYTPTWRMYNHTFEQLALKKLNRFCREHGVAFVIKLHYKHDCHLDVGGLSNVLEYNQYDDVYPLLTRTELLVTDYSSIYLDFLILDRPVIFFPYDGEAYIGNERELLLDYDTITPGPKCYNQDELEREIYKHLVEGSDEYKEQRKALAGKFFKYRDGRSSERLWRAIQKHILA
jgi:CDP-glycerol glycerophosphotransferase (TagB/SpsB family)